MKKVKGFSLLELLIVVSIIGILAAIAYPSYQDSQVKGNRAAAKAYLLEVTQKQQQFLLDNRAYATDAEIKAVAPPPREVDNFYTIVVDEDNAATPPAFTVKATPKPGTRQKNDGYLEIDQSGKKFWEKGTW